MMREYVIPVTRRDHPGVDLIKIYAAQKREAEKYIRRWYRNAAVRIVTSKDKEKEEGDVTGRVKVEN